MPCELTKKKKKSSFCSVVFLSYATMTNHFPIRLWHDEKWILYNNWTTGDDQLSGWTEKRFQSTSQSQICMKKRSWSLFSGLLSVWSTTASESWQNHYIWEVNSGNWWDPPKTSMPAASIHQEEGPNSSWQHPTAWCTTNTSKLNELGYKVLPHSP